MTHTTKLPRPKPKKPKSKTKNKEEIIKLVESLAGGLKTKGPDLTPEEINKIIDESYDKEIYK